MMQEVSEAELTQIPVKQTILEKIKGKINDKINDQDFNQKMAVSIAVILEFYRVLVSSFLVLFVPQKCDDHVCSLSENMVFENHLYNAGLVFNFITMASFLAMYTLEIKRENRLITYLEVNKAVASDNNSVGTALEKLSVEKRDSIWQLDKYYMYSGRASIIIFIVNTILSGFVVYEYYLDSQTTSTYITNILFMVTKLADVYANVNTEKNVFYSAYMKGKIQYNDVDPNKIMVPGISHPLQDEVIKSDSEIVIKSDEEKEQVKEEVKEEDKEEVLNVSVSDSKSDSKSDSNSVSDSEIEEEPEKIIVTIHDINSPKSSTNDLQAFNDPQ
jgi:hypothetical protein